MWVIIMSFGCIKNAAQCTVLYDAQYLQLQKFIANKHHMSLTVMHRLVRVTLIRLAGYFSGGHAYNLILAKPA